MTAIETVFARTVLHTTKNRLPSRTNCFKDSRGMWRIVFRPKDGPKKTILAGMTSKGAATAYYFKHGLGAVYDSMVNGGVPFEIKRTGGNGSGTMNAAIESYFKSPKFLSLAPETHRSYRAALKTVQEDHGHRFVVDLTRQSARTVIEAIAANSPAQANIAKAVLNVIMKRAITDGVRESNPFDLLESYKMGEHRTWTEEEITKYENRWAVGTMQRLLFATMLYTGQRGESDVRRLRRSMIVKGWIHEFKQKKTKTIVDIPIHPELARIILLTNGGDYFAENRKGEQMPESSLRKLMSDAIDEAGLPDDCVPHGLRKACCRRLAEAGATVLQIMAITGHKSVEEVERYTKGVDQKKMAAQAMALLSEFGDKAAPLMLEYKPESERVAA